MRHCKKCNQQIAENSVFCMSCGHNQNEPVHINCKGCGQPLPATAVFCDKCGHKQAIPVPNSELPPIVPISSVAEQRPPVETPHNPVNEENLLPPKKGLAGVFWNYWNLKKIEKSARPKAIFSALLAFGVICAVVMVAILGFMRMQGAQEIREREARQNPTPAAVVSSWNTEAGRAPTGSTHGVSITENDILSMEEIELSNGATVRFTVSSGASIRVGGVYYNAPNLPQGDYEQALANILQAVFPMDNGNLSTINQNLSETIDTMPISEAVTGFSLERSGNRISVDVIYPYEKQLALSNQITGLNFGLSLAEFTRNFSSLYHQADGGTTFRTSGVSNDDFIDAAQTAVYNNLQSPSTAVWGNANVISRDTYGRAIVSVVVDSQNAFGAVMRSYILVVIQGFTSADNFTYNTANGIAFFNNRSEMELGVDLMKVANSFEQPRHADVIEESDFEEHGQIDGYSVYLREDFFTVLLYVDSDERIVAIRLTAPATSIENTDLLRVYVAALMQELSLSDARDILRNIFDFSTQTPIGHIYQNGIVYASHIDGGIVTFDIAAVRTSQYENGVKFPVQGDVEPTADNTPNESGILTAKHILVSDGALAQRLHQELMGLSGEAQRTRFVEMIATYGEDPGMETNPNGYTFEPDVMVSEFTAGTQALAYYEISAPIHSQFGYHIILRLPVPAGAEIMRSSGATTGDEVGINIADLLDANFNEIQHLFGNLTSVDEEMGLWRGHWFDTGVMVGVGEMGEVAYISVNFRLFGSEVFNYNGVDSTFARNDARAVLGTPDNSGLDWNNVIGAMLEWDAYWTIVNDGWVEQAVSIYFDDSDRVIGISFAWSS